VSHRSSNRPSAFGRLVEDEASLDHVLSSDTSAPEKKPEPPKNLARSLWELDVSQLRTEAQHLDARTLAKTRPGLAGQDVYESLWKAFDAAVTENHLKVAQENLALLEALRSEFEELALKLKGRLDDELRGGSERLELPQEGIASHEKFTADCQRACAEWDLEKGERLLALIRDLNLQSNANHALRHSVEEDLARHREFVAGEQKKELQPKQKTALEGIQKLLLEVEDLAVQKRWQAAKQKDNPLSDLISDYRYPPVEDAGTDVDPEESSGADEQEPSDEADADEQHEEDQSPAALRLKASLEEGAGDGPCLKLGVPTLTGRGAIDTFREELRAALERDSAKLPALPNGMTVDGLTFACSKPVVATQGPKAQPDKSLSRAAKTIGQIAQNGMQLASGMFAFHVGVTLDKSAQGDAAIGWRVRAVQNCLGSSREVIYKDQSRMFVKIGFACQDVVGDSHALEPGKTTMVSLTDAPSWRWVHKEGTEVAQVEVHDRFRVFVLVTTPKNEDRCLLYMDWSFRANASSGTYAVDALTPCTGASSEGAVTKGMAMNLINEAYQPGPSGR
jgi:hypothetical protein